MSTSTFHGSLRFAYSVFQFCLFLSLAVFPLFLGGALLWGFAIGAFILSFSFLFYWMHWMHASEGEVLVTVLDRWIALYLAVFLVSTIFSRIPSISCVEAYKLLAVVAAFYATVYYAKDRYRIIRLTQLIVLLGAVLSAAGLIQFMGGLPKDWWDKAFYLSSTFVNHNHFAGFLILVLPLTLGLALAERENSKKVLYVFFCVLMGTAFIFTLSRGGFAALAAALVLQIYLIRRRRLVKSSAVPFILFVVLVLTAVIVLGTEPLEQRIEKTVNMDQDAELSMQYRLLTWQGTLKMLPSYLIAGSGPGTFGSVFLKYRPQGFSQRPEFAHNDYLQLLSDMGVVAFIVVAVMLWILFTKGWKILRRDESRMRIGVGSGCMAGIAGLLVHGLIDFNFHLPANWLFSAVLAGILFSLDGQEAYPQKAVEGKIISKALPAALIAVTGLSIFYGISSYAHWEAKELWKQRSKAEALKAVNRSLLINPFNAEAYYLRGFIRASIAKAGVGEPDKIREAVSDFEKAASINRYEPIYDFHKAGAQSVILSGDSPKDLILLYQKALQKDPNNPKLSFMAAMAILNSDDRRRPVLRVAAEGMLKRAIELNPDFAEASYDLLWSHDRNISKIQAFHETVPGGLKGLVAFLQKQDLWKHFRKYYLELAGIDPDAHKTRTQSMKWNEKSPETLYLKNFSSAGKEKIHTDELFHTAGELTKKVYVRDPLSRLALYARANPAGGIYPILAIKIDGAVQDVHYIDSAVFKNYYTLLNVPRGEHLLSLAYLNDHLYESNPGEDRNVIISRIDMQEPAGEGQA